MPSAHPRHPPQQTRRQPLARPGALCFVTVIVACGGPGSEDPSGPYAEGIADRCDADPHAVTFEAAAGGSTTWTDDFGGSMTLTKPGTWFLCEGEWSVTLEVLAHDVAIVGAGPEWTTLRGDGQHVIGAMAVEGLALSDLTVTGGYSEGPADGPIGAGLQLDAGAASVSRVRFVDNHSLAVGGAIAARGATLRVEDCTFQENSAAMGAGVFLEEAELVIRDAEFVDNDADIGGGISGWPGEVDGEGLVFEGNRSTMTAGAVSLLSGSSGRLSDVRFTNNTTEGHGGALDVSGSELTLESGSFEGNVAEKLGGGVVIVSSRVEMSAADFVDNEAFDLYDWEREESRDLGLDAELSCTPSGCL